MTAILPTLDPIEAAPVSELLADQPELIEELGLIAGTGPVKCSSGSRCPSAHCYGTG